MVSEVTLVRRWVKAANGLSTVSSTLTSAEDMETDWMERKSVELADMAWTPSSDIGKWLANQGWALPSSTVKMPYLPGREVSQVGEGERSAREGGLTKLLY
jgi:hypothetical protein